MLGITKKGEKVWVTFTAPVEESEAVELMGEWNDWEPEVMKQKKNGDFYLTKVLDAGSVYQFGYHNDGEWVIEEILECIESPFGSHNSVLEL